MILGQAWTYCIWEGGQVIAEYSDAPQQGSGGLKYYEADRLSTRLVTGSTGSVLGTQDHLPSARRRESRARARNTGSRNTSEMRRAIRITL